MEILRRDWGFDGAVVTDWGGSNDHALGVKNGSTLEMPAPGGDAVRELLKAVETGKISESCLLYTSRGKNNIYSYTGGKFKRQL